jgi:hypothetical protein
LEISAAGQCSIEHGGGQIGLVAAGVERVGLHYLTWISSGGGKTKSALFAMEVEVVDHRPASAVLTVTIKSSCAM